MNTYCKMLILLITLLSFNVLSIQAQTFKIGKPQKAQTTKNLKVNADCPAPFNLEVTEITNSSVTLAWESELQGVAFLVTYTNETTGESFTVNTNELGIIIDDLDAGTTYNIGVQTICGNDLISPTTTTTIETVDIQAMHADLDIIPFPGIGGIGGRNLFENDNYTYKDMNNPPITVTIHNAGVASIIKIKSSNSSSWQNVSNWPINTNGTRTIPLLNGTIAINCDNGAATYASTTGNPYDYFQYEIADISNKATKDNAFVLICPADDRRCSIEYVQKMANQ